MDIKLYTDKNYVPYNELKNVASGYETEIVEYRKGFIEVIPLGDLSFGNIVETPTLVKKRFTKNIELKGKIQMEAENYDYILEIAKELVRGKDISGIILSERKKLIKAFKENQNDLTIITEFLINNFEKLVQDDGARDTLEHIYPWMSRYDINFVKNYNNRKMNYSINDFQTLNNCSYETSRKSMEKLEENKLYEKIKVGKKFVYRPTEKLQTMIGGER